MRASDIHLVQDNHPDAPNWIQYRIDGDLMPMHLLPAEAMARLTTLLKRDAGLNFGLIQWGTPHDVFEVQFNAALRSNRVEVVVLVEG